VPVTRGIVQRSFKRGPVSDLENSAYRSAIIAMASSGASRRTVAARMGKPESTIRGWIERGLAYPEIEPWGSFAVQYQQAERGMADAVGKASALRLVIMLERLERYRVWEQRPPFSMQKPVPPAKLGRSSTAEQRAEWKVLMQQFEQASLDYDLAFGAWATPPPIPDVADMVWMERLREARHPEDYGTSKHRKPEPQFDANNWLETNGMDREQLGALLRDPPDVLALAIADEARALYARIMASGFDPEAPVTRKAEDETE
jgi:hypothetical protein